MNILPEPCPSLHRDITQVKVRGSGTGPAQTLGQFSERGRIYCPGELCVLLPPSFSSFWRVGFSFSILCVLPSFELKTQGVSQPALGPSPAGK